MSYFPGAHFQLSATAEKHASSNNRAQADTRHKKRKHPLGPSLPFHKTHKKGSWVLVRCLEPAWGWAAGESDPDTALMTSYLSWMPVVVVVVVVWFESRDVGATTPHPSGRTLTTCKSTFRDMMLSLRPSSRRSSAAHHVPSPPGSVS
ncbi:unnamed protein product [Pleuronectes platessa]|uniref:Uncharacterized protein n=1 Tax=Pleuronectes platessa TaxID=8262 RepID=A0A9N7YYW6_PLEPL|nr:unnamed protein product [Pleuronectes platessa]